MEEETPYEEAEQLIPQGSERFFEHLANIQNFSETGNAERLIENPDCLKGLCDFLYNFKEDKDAKTLRTVHKDSQPLFKKKSSHPLRSQALRNNLPRIQALVGAFLEEFAGSDSSSEEEEEEEW